jgi:hypothetical protein
MEIRNLLEASSLLLTDHDDGGFVSELEFQSLCMSDPWGYS